MQIPLEGAQVDYDSEEYSSHFRNKILILKTLDELLVQKSFEKISVSEICECAHVSRSMFYVYFKNKAAVTQWYLRFAMDKGVNKVGINYSWFDGHLITTRTFADYRRACYSVLNSSHHSEDFGFFTEIRRAALHEAFEKKGIALTPKLDFQMEAVIAGELVATNKWFNQLSIKELTAYLVSIVPQDLYNALNNPINPKHV